MIDLRLPIGIFFAILGLILVAMPGMRGELSTAPVNLYSGIAMLVFAGAMLWLGRRRS
jgi:drug/metabolite transporter (DMT)-like permease